MSAAEEDSSHYKNLILSFVQYQSSRPIYICTHYITKVEQ